MPRILYFGSFSKPYDTEVYIANTLENLGCEVVSKETPNIRKEKLIKLLEEKWDCVLFSKGWFPFNLTEQLKIIGEYPGMTVGWFWDICWETKNEILVGTHHLFRAKKVLTTDGGNDEKWKAAGIDHSVLRQGIYEPEAIIGKFKEEFACDVAFVGGSQHEKIFGWEHRTKLLEFLRNTYGDRFKHFGEDRQIRNLELNDLYASAKVVVGDSLLSPHYWSNRIYETTGRGGFLIFPKVPGLEEEFEYYKHIVPYEIGDWNGLKEKIDYYLSHDKERKEIQMAGFEHCKNNLTYTHRCKELLSYL